MLGQSSVREPLDETTIQPDVDYIWNRKRRLSEWIKCRFGIIP